MAKICKEQDAFLTQYGVPLSKVFDAEGWKTAAYQTKMKELDQWVAIGVKACANYGHTMRSRSGQCIQCDPKQLNFFLRYDLPGEVYVASSTSMGFIKIGSSNDSMKRMSNLNSYCYGGANDWRVAFSIACGKANRAEVEAHKLLSEFRVRNPVPTYIKEGKQIECRELFTCGEVTAIRAVRKAISDHGGNRVNGSIAYEDELDAYEPVLNEYGEWVHRASNTMVDQSKPFERKFHKPEDAFLPLPSAKPKSPHPNEVAYRKQLERRLNEVNSQTVILTAKLGSLGGMPVKNLSTFGWRYFCEFGPVTMMMFGVLVFNNYRNPELSWAVIGLFALGRLFSSNARKMEKEFNEGYQKCYEIQSQLTSLEAEANNLTLKLSSPVPIHILYPLSI